MPIVIAATLLGTSAWTAGAGALRLYIDGRQDDGTLWVARPVGTLDGAADLTLRFQFHSPFGGSFRSSPRARLPSALTRAAPPRARRRHP